VAADLKAMVSAAGGYFAVAADPTSPYVVLTSGSLRSWACILSYQGDSPAGEEIPGAMMSPAVEVFVGASVDLRKDPGAWLYVDASAEQKSLLSRLDAVDVHMRGIVFKGDGADSATYARYQPAAAVVLPGAGIPLRAWRLRYAWDVRLDQEGIAYRFLNSPA
jgi:hypothetical protein